MRFNLAFTLLISLASTQFACRAGFVSLDGATVKSQAASGNGDATGDGNPADVKADDSPLCLNTAALDEEESKLVFIENVADCPTKATKDPEKPNLDDKSKDPPTTPPKDPAKDPPVNNPPKPDTPTQGDQGKDKPNQNDEETEY